jgi:signal transduction histidine kinase/CheY-like chemotaxis protein
MPRPDDLAPSSDPDTAAVGDPAHVAAALTALADAWFVIDADGLHQRCSHARHPLLPVADAQLCGQPLGHGLPQAQAERWRAAWRQAVASSAPERFECELVPVNGAAQVVEVAVAPLGADETLFLLRDITVARARQDTLRDQQAAAIANRAKSEFLSRVSHEMRTPLNAVIGFTQLLRLSPEGAGPAQLSDFTDHVLRASQQLLALINDLLDLQRVEENRLTLERRPLALQPLVDAVFELLRPRAAQHGVVLRNEVDAGAMVLADAQRTRQVLLSIVTNAIQYNRPGGWVRVALLSPTEGNVVFAVEDTGAGVTAEQSTRLFQPFERLGRESTAVEGGGLGLVIARRLAQAMGGDVDLGARTDGAGTRVRIALPDARAAAVRSPVTSTAFEGAALRMLYVEDNRINAILFEEAMRMHGGIELRVAEDGAEALSLARDWVPEVLVLDAHLPDMNGYDVLQRMRALPDLADVPAYMCSADAMDDDLRRARSAGFAGYWTKPIDIARVMADLEPLLAGSDGAAPLQRAS